MTASIAPATNAAAGVIFGSLHRLVELDLVFNAVMLAYDGLVVWLMLLLRRRGFPPARIRPWAHVALVVPVGLAVVIAFLYQERVFLVFRFVGMAVFWHLPLLLAILAGRFREHRRLHREMIALAACLVVVYMYAYHVEPYRLEVTRYDFTDPRLTGLRRPVVIAQVSDIQTDDAGPWERRVAAKLAALKPDVVVYCGDYIHVWNDAEYVREAPKLREVLARARLAPPLGSFAVPGDCDAHGIEDHALWEEVFQGLPVRLLKDEAIQIALPGVRVNLIGLTAGTSRAGGPRELARALERRQTGLLDVVVAHAPDFVEAWATRDEPFLALAGHTHGGQVRLPFVGPLLTLSRLPRRLCDGVAPYGRGVLSVSRGIGMERRDAPRLRFLCRPEIRLITLRPPTPVR